VTTTVDILRAVADRRLRPATVITARRG
jgi:hypothetical protein